MDFTYNRLRSMPKLDKAKIHFVFGELYQFDTQLIISKQYIKRIQLLDLEKVVYVVINNNLQLPCLRINYDRIPKVLKVLYQNQKFTYDDKHNFVNSRDLSFIQELSDHNTVNLDSIYNHLEQEVSKSLRTKK